MLPRTTLARLVIIVESLILLAVLRLGLPLLEGLQVLARESPGHHLDASLELAALHCAVLAPMLFLL